MSYGILRIECVAVNAARHRGAVGGQMIQSLVNAKPDQEAPGSERRRHSDREEGVSGAFSVGMA